jgi:hypothetical protein
MNRHTESMSAKTKQLRVVVDAGVGRDSALLHQASSWLGERIGEMFWLDDAHHGIPDVEILDKVLGNDTVLVTRDCVLHNRAHKQGFLSLTLDRQGRLTQRLLPGIRLPKQEAASTAAELRADYVREPSPITLKLRQGLSEKQLKKRRTLLDGLSEYSVHACTKGRFHDTAENKRDQLTRSKTNEVVTVDFAAMRTMLLQHEDGLGAPKCSPMAM